MPEAESSAYRVVNVDLHSPRDFELLICEIFQHGCKHNINPERGGEYRLKKGKSQNESITENFPSKKVSSQLLPSRIH